MRLNMIIQDPEIRDGSGSVQNTMKNNRENILKIYAL